MTKTSKLSKLTSLKKISGAAIDPKDKEEWRNKVSLPQTSLGIIIPEGEPFINEQNVVET